jgi:hypothetical protein
MPEEKCFVTLQTRLAKYGLEHLEGKLPDLKLQPSQKLTLTPDDPQTAKYLVTLNPQSPHDLKRWIGIPNTAFAKASGCPVFVPQPPIATDEPGMRANLANYLFSNSTAVTETQVGALKSFISRVNINVNIVLLFDIYVSAGATLVVDSKIQVLWANNITVEETGLIQMNSPFAKVDCAGFRTIIPFHVVGVGGVSSVLSRA